MLYNRLFCFFFMMLSTVYGYAQDKHEIYLKKVITNKIKVGYEYQLVNPKDTAYVLVERSGDFGIVHSTHFVIKDKLPDGEYNIYIEDKLTSVLT